MAKPKKKTATKKKPKAAAKAKPKAAVKAKPKAPARAKPKAKRKPAAKTKPKAATKAKSVRREDRPGHYDPKYAAKLRRLGRHPRDDDRAFVGSRTDDDLAEELGEEAVVAMTSGEDGLGDDLQRNVPEDRGGPFVRSTGAKEFAGGTDASNPEDALREPFPKT